MTPEEIDQAVAKGIITPGQALELKAEASKKDPGVEEEPFAFVDNFGAVFVVVGLVILQGAPWLFGNGARRPRRAAALWRLRRHLLVLGRRLRPREAPAAGDRIRLALRL